jgi:predicted phosphodiesterase
MIITGDCHGKFHKLNNNHIRQANNDEFPEHVLVAGDFGLVWSNASYFDKEEQYWTKWFNEKPYETLVCLGNHENYERIYRLSIVEKYGAPMYQLSDKIFFFQHGNIYRIEEKDVFVYGGATSVDKEQRRNRITWWHEEVPNYESEKRAFNTLSNSNRRVNIVLTHTAPSIAIDALDKDLFVEDREDHVVKALDAMLEYIPKTATWYCGHLHEDEDRLVDGLQFRFLYDRLIKE